MSGLEQLLIGEGLRGEQIPTPRRYITRPDDAFYSVLPTSILEAEEVPALRRQSPRVLLECTQRAGDVVFAPESCVAALWRWQAQIASSCFFRSPTTGCAQADPQPTHSPTHDCDHPARKLRRHGLNIHRHKQPPTNQHQVSGTVRPRRLAPRRNRSRVFLSSSSS